MLELQIADTRYTKLHTMHHMDFLHKALRVRQPGCEFASAYKRRLWDGYINFVNKNGFFLGGLTELAIKAMAKIELPAKIVEDLRGDAPAYYSPVLHGRTRYPHQEAAAEAVTTNTFLGHAWPRGIIKIATGGGKTTVIADLAGGYKREEVLILLHRKELLHQTAEDLEHVLHERIGKVGDGICSIKRITVGTVQTLTARSDSFENWLNRIGVLLVDEAHHLAAESHQAIVDEIPAFVRVGFSATPFKTNDPVQNRYVQGMTGNILYDLDASTLADMGVVTPVIIHYTRVMHAPTVTKPNGLPASAEYLSWPDAYKHLIVDSTLRNMRIAACAKQSTEPTLIIVQRVQHGINLANRLQCPFMSGTENTETRRQALDDLGSGRIPYLVATTIFDEGVDVPSISRLILAAGGKSDLQLLQRIGRGMRRSEGKTELHVYDFFDESNKHLRQHSIERIAAAKQAGFRTELAA